MAIGGTKSRGYLSGKECFELWIKLGSVKKTVAHLKGQGLVNPDNGKPPTAMGVWAAAMRFMINNVEWSRNYMISACDTLYATTGDTSLWFVKDDYQFYRYLIEKAIKNNILNIDKLREFFNRSDVAPYVTDRERELVR